MAATLQAIDALIDRMSNEERVINIFCFGDSLTYGTYNNNFFDKAPYSKTLYKLIKSYLNDNGNLNDKYKLSIKTRGIPGLCAMDMKDKLNKYLLKHKNGEYNIDLMIILGGTNDIGQGYYENKQIISSIIDLHKSCHSTGISKTLLITIPQCKNQTTQLVKIRDEINTKLIQFHQENQNKVLLFDMNKEIPYSDNNKIWSQDGLHLSPLGYEKMANCIFNILQPWIKKLLQI